MKKKSYYFLMILLIIAMFSNAQDTSHVLPIDTTKFYLTEKAGSCGSPDGPMNSIPAPPPSYAWLQANGYCNPNSYGTSPTVCWTFTPTSSSVTINSGYSQSGCVNVAFGAFNLYNAACVQIGTGLNFSGLTPGLQYTWCMSGAAWGGGPGCIGFTDFCPYYTNNTVLPIEMLEFHCNENKLVWITESEINNSHFRIETTEDGKTWTYLKSVVGAGYSTLPMFYETEVDGTYVRLIQVDFDGNYSYYGPTYCGKYEDVETEEEMYFNLRGERLNSIPSNQITIIKTHDSFRKVFKLAIE